ncbi:MAG: carbohydrate-binding family 9-like protein [Verrucomicrobiota bacterium]
MSFDPIALPTLECRLRTLSHLSADPGSVFWRGIPAVALFEAIKGEAPRQATTVRCAWDRSELRLLFDCEDDHIVATLTERDGPLYTEEVIEVFLDPVGDLEGYFEIEVNPLNAVLDLVLRRTRSGYAKDFSWQCEGLRSEVRKNAARWSVELSIPFTSLLPEPPVHGSRWRANFCRIDRPPGRPRELSAWSPSYRDSFHTPERFGFLEFIAAE